MMYKDTGTYIILDFDSQNIPKGSHPIVIVILYM